MKKNVLITGGCGFVGKNIINLLYKKFNLTVVDNFSSGDNNFIPKKITIKNLNIDNKIKLLKLFKKNRFDIVIHCAANFANQNSIDNIYKDFNSNILGTLNLLKVSNIFKIKKFIYLSSSCVYSDFNSNENIVNPSYKTPYAISKFSAEQYVSFYNYYYKLNSSIFRLYNFYGPFDYVGKYRNVVPNFISKALKNKTIEIHGTGKSTRDFTYVEDFNQILEKILGNNFNYNKIYNFGASNPINIINLAKKIVKITKSNSKIKFVPTRSWDKYSKRTANNKKLKKEFKGIKFTSIDKGLKHTIEWFKKNNNL